MRVYQSFFAGALIFVLVGTAGTNVNNLVTGVVFPDGGSQFQKQNGWNAQPAFWWFIQLGVVTSTSVTLTIWLTVILTGIIAVAEEEMKISKQNEKLVDPNQGPPTRR